MGMFPMLAKAVVWIFESLMGLMVLAFIGLVLWVIVSAVMHASRT